MSWFAISGMYRAQTKLDAIVAPTVGDDLTKGFSSGSIWIDNVARIAYVCTDASTGAAKWDDFGTVPVGGVIYKGVWNANTNTPTLADSGVGGVKGDYYVVGTAGTTTIDGESDWNPPDWIVNRGTQWDKVDNTQNVHAIGGSLHSASTLAEFNAKLTGGNVDFDTGSRPASTVAGAAGKAANVQFSDQSIVYRDSEPSPGGNVAATFAVAHALAVLSEGNIEIVIDASIAPCTTGAGAFDMNGIKLAAGWPTTELTVSDGCTLPNLQYTDDWLVLICDASAPPITITAGNIPFYNGFGCKIKSNAGKAPLIEASGSSILIFAGRPFADTLDGGADVIELKDTAQLRMTVGLGGTLEDETIKSAVGTTAKIYHGAHSAEIGTTQSNALGDFGVFYDKGDGAVAVGVRAGVTAAYKNLQSFLDVNASPMVLDGGDVTDNGDGTVAVTAAECMTKATDSATGEAVFFKAPAVDPLALTDNVRNYLEVDYNGGTPQIVATPSSATMHDYDRIYVAHIFRNGTDLDIVPLVPNQNNFAHRMALRYMDKFDTSFEHASGMRLADAGTLHLSLSAGVYYAHLVRQVCRAFITVTVATATHDGGNNEAILTDSGEAWTPNEWIHRLVSNITDGSAAEIADNDATTITGALSGGTDDDWDTGDNYELSDFFDAYYSDGGAGWTEVANQRTIDNGFYDGGGGALVALTAQQYAVHWVYIDTGTRHLASVYGTDSYTLVAANNAEAPSSLPPKIASWYTLVGKVIVKKSATTMDVISAFETLFHGSRAADHVDLLNKGTKLHAVIDSEIDANTAALAARPVAVYNFRTGFFRSPADADWYLNVAADNANDPDNAAIQAIALDAVASEGRGFDLAAPVAATEIEIITNCKAAVAPAGGAKTATLALATRLFGDDVAQPAWVSNNIGVIDLPDATRYYQRDTTGRVSLASFGLVLGREYQCEIWRDVAGSNTLTTDLLLSQMTIVFY